MVVSPPSSSSSSRIGSPLMLAARSGRQPISVQPGQVRCFSSSLPSRFAQSSPASGWFSPSKPAEPLQTSPSEALADKDNATISAVDANAVDSDSAAAAISNSDSLVEPLSKTFAELDTSWWPNVNASEWLYNTVQTTTGLPWWATIIIVTAGVRCVLFPIVARGQARSARLANVQPKMNAMMADLKEAKASGSQLHYQQMLVKTQKFMADEKVNPAGMLILPAIQGPLFMSFFFSLKSMGEQGLNTMKDGGALWFPDLTMADPTTWSLPILSAAATMIIIETGAEMGAASTPNQQQKVMRWVMRGMIGTMPFWVYHLPAACLVYFVSSAATSLIQLLVLKLPFMKKAFGIPDRINHKENETAASSKKPKREMTFAEAVRAGYDSQQPVDPISVTPESSPSQSPQEAAYAKWFKKPEAAGVETSSTTASASSASVPPQASVAQSASAATGATSSLFEDAASGPSKQHEAKAAAQQQKAEREQAEADQKRAKVQAARSRRRSGRSRI